MQGFSDHWTDRALNSTDFVVDKQEDIITERFNFEPTFPAVVLPVKQGCLPSNRPNAAVRAWILWLNLSVKIGTNMAKNRQS